MNATLISNSLGKSNRLKSRKSIARLFAEGQVINIFPIRSLYRFTEEPLMLKAAFSASSRNFRKAVDRNRLKRVMREAYRIRKAELENSLLKENRGMELFFVYTAKELTDQVKVDAAMDSILKKLSAVSGSKKR